MPTDLDRRHPPHAHGRGRWALRPLGRRGTPRRHERGTSLVEVVVGVPLALVLTVGLVEVGGGIEARSDTASAARVGAYAASEAAADPMADAIILDELAGQLPSMRGAEIELVVIWRASSPDESVPTSCLRYDVEHPNTVSAGERGESAEGVAWCNSYAAPSRPGGAFGLAAGVGGVPREQSFGCTGADDPAAPTKLDCMWPAAFRQPAASATFIGVYVQVHHGGYTGFLGDGFVVGGEFVRPLTAPAPSPA